METIQSRLHTHSTGHPFITPGRIRRPRHSAFKRAALSLALVALASVAVSVCLSGQAARIEAERGKREAARVEAAHREAVTNSVPAHILNILEKPEELNDLERAALSHWKLKNTEN